MAPTITAFERSPDRGRGLARDMRVRWALEEVGQPYDVTLVSFPALKGPEHLARNPFGQIPTYDDGDVSLFESGSILMRIADRHVGLLPTDPDARAWAVTWMFASLNTVEPPIFDYSLASILERDKPWHEERLAALQTQIDARLTRLDAYLGDADWLAGDFSAADILMVTVLMRADAAGLLAPYPTLKAYLERARARPAFQRAFDAQRSVFEASEPA